ncbi:MAG: D-2-hydroxyacid dehydrogenase [Haloferacaceae archaeon]
MGETTTDPDVVVVRQKVHGRPASDYADVLEELLPDHEVALAATPAQERDLVARADVATGVHIDESLLEVADIDLFSCVYAGTDHLPMEALRERGVAVTSASGVHGPNIAEYVIGAVIAFTRDFRRAWRQQERGVWSSFHAGELHGSTATVVGMGAIGRTVVDRLDAFGVETLGVRYTPEKGGPTDEVYGLDDLHDPLSRSDHVVLACPLTEETEGLIGEEEFLTMPTEAILVNIARGPVVDTGALVSALRWNDIGAAAVDVTDPEPLPEDHPLWTFEDALVTPHNAGETPEYYRRAAEILARNLRRVAETGRYEDLENQVI